jgi:hypothetical protein
VAKMAELGTGIEPGLVIRTRRTIESHHGLLTHSSPSQVAARRRSGATRATRRGSAGRAAATPPAAERCASPLPRLSRG